MSTDNKQKGSLFRSASLVSSATAGSRILGLIREQVMAYLFGASMATDAFVVAFRIPNLLRDMFAEGALVSSFVPVFKERLVKNDKKEAFELASAMMGAILLIVGLIVLLGIIATPAVVYVMANGFAADTAKFDLTVDLTRLMFVYLLLVSLSALLMGMLNSFGKFGLPALAPAMFNLGMIGSMLLLRQFFEIPIFALAVGVLIGGTAQLLIQLPPLIRAGFRLKPKLDFLHEGVKKVFRLFMPMILGMSAGRINILLGTLLASFLAEGSLSYLNYSFRLMHFPLGVFAVALGTVALPQASEMVARGDLTGLRETLRESISLNLLLILPSAWVIALWGEDIVRLIFQHGQFDAADTTNTTRALLHYSYGLIGFAAVRVTTPVYYALGDSKLPMRLSIISVGVNMALYYPMIQLFGFAGLAAATSISSLINWGLLLFFLPSKGLSLGLGRLSLSVLRIMLAAFFAVYSATMIPWDLSFGLTGTSGLVLTLASRMLLAALFYLGLCFVFRVRELSIIKRALFKSKS